MVKTYGLTHLALAVGDVEQSMRFYADMFGMEAYFREEGRIHARTPGCQDVITFDQTVPKTGDIGGVVHFGFRLTKPEDIDSAVQDVERAGGQLLRRGEFSPGYPYAYVADPDWYEVEIWFE